MNSFIGWGWRKWAFLEAGNGCGPPSPQVRSLFSDCSEAGLCVYAGAAVEWGFFYFFDASILEFKLGVDLPFNPHTVGYFLSPQSVSPWSGINRRTPLPLQKTHTHHTGVECVKRFVHPAVRGAAAHRIVGNLIVAVDFCKSSDTRDFLR